MFPALSNQDSSNSVDDPSEIIYRDLTDNLEALKNQKSLNLSWF